MPPDLKGRRALVTGGARRIGRAVCLALAERGARVAVHYHRSQQEGEEVARACGGFAIQADLRTESAARGLVRDAARLLGGLDILVNNAAVYERVAASEIDQEIWDRHLDTNLRGPVFAALEAASLMDEGVVINLTDWGTARPHPDFLPYYAAKAGLAAMTAGLARALAPRVRVNAVAPGPIHVDPAVAEKVRRKTPLRRMGDDESVVLTVLFLIGNDYVTGETITVDGGRSLS